MPAEWAEYSFTELIEVKALEIGDGYRAKNSELGGDGPIFLRAGHVRDTYIDLEGVDRFQSDLAKAVASKMCQLRDVIVTTKGNSTGRTSYVSNDLPPFVYSPHLSYWRCLDTEIIDPGFLRYWSQSQDFRNQLAGLSASTDMAPYLSLIDQKRLKIVLPSIHEQRAIGRILGALDDKIELNRRMNEALEAIARALFKSWFVDFDPVRAKAAGRHPGLPEPIADLFPNCLIESELGEIPEGWDPQSFAETVEIIGGGTPKTSVAAYWNGDIPWFSVVDAPTKMDVWVVDTQKKITRAGVENSSTRLLQVGTTIISARGTVGRVALVGVPMAMNQSCYGIIGKVEASNFFTYFLTKELVASLQQHAHGSVFDTITRDTLAGIYVVVPPKPVIETFETIAGPFLERVRQALLNSGTLAALRDALLLKLISGELSIAGSSGFVDGET